MLRRLGGFDSPTDFCLKVVMRIAHIITRREFRGAEVVARDLCVQLARRGHEVSLVGLFQPPCDRQARSLTIDLDQVADLGGPKQRGLSLKIPLRLRKELARFRPDVVQANAFNALKFASLVKWATRASWPLVYRNVGLAGRWVTRPGQRAFGRFLLSQVNHVVSVSQASRSDFHQTYEYPEELIAIALQGVEIPARLDREGWRRELCQAAQCSPHDPLLIHVGNFSPEKNHQGLIEAFTQIVERRPQSCLVLVGEGPLRPVIENQVKHEGLGQRVRFLGARADAATLAGGADLMLLSSHVEGVPGVVLEACARATPVVGVEVGGMNQVINNGVTGVLVAAGDMQTLAEETSRLLQHEQERTRLGLASREFVARRHDFQASVDQMESLYEELLQRERRSRQINA